jgi:hypothetical protein
MAIIVGALDEAARWVCSAGAGSGRLWLLRSNCLAARANLRAAKFSREVSGPKNSVESKLARSPKDRGRSATPQAVRESGGLDGNVPVIEDFCAGD